MSAAVIRPVAIKIDDDIKDRIKRLALARNRSPHWLMRDAIFQYVDREEKREAFRHDAIAAWNAYQATGLHVSMEQADSWLDKLEVGDDAVPPTCHV